MRTTWNRISLGWCRIFHPEPSWPVHGHYHCPACFRTFPVPWLEGEDFLRRELSSIRSVRRPADFAVLDFQKDQG